ncbi:hypothetical protein BBH88_18620 (plasmid) [Planococcus antarcticus DSM 14505]|uniref:DUF3953 domain-containing protein n=1 Tax=Planococcus antarcticus DSM 14505 TaxID=1185653 RepID=A0ABM6D9Y1_9BACL|nr:DUF3953 domain-containing protein [Planococcus antarcticus]ANU12341.1 hypothetical protein BBH88_18505 [Planococcus antarcticus DSM 14505]ANU12344.1 hypothetical protein BBH88_18620 [Planococcus antarcticus DSM 14505]
MLTILHILLAVLTLGLALFALLTQNFDYQYYTLLSLGLMILVMGIKELRKEKKIFAYLIILVAAYILFVAGELLLTS